MDLLIEPLTGANAADFFDFFDNRAFSNDSPDASCYCNCFHLTADEVCIGIQARADALGGGFDGMKGTLRESAAELIGKGVLPGGGRLLHFSGRTWEDKVHRLL